MDLNVTAVLQAISDDASLELFKLIALTNGTSDSLRAKMNITRKQYYSRLFKMRRCGLVKKDDNRYALTTLGSATYEAQAAVERALQSYWKIRAVGPLDSSAILSQEDDKRIIESVI